MNPRHATRNGDLAPGSDTFYTTRERQDTRHMIVHSGQVARRLRTRLTEHGTIKTRQVRRESAKAWDVLEIRRFFDAKDGDPKRGGVFEALPVDVHVPPRAARR